METLALACLVFLATHFVSSTPLRTVAVDAIGEKAWLALYTVIAFATIGWMVWAYNRAPVEPLWAGWRLAPAVLMPFAFILIAGGLLTRNPTAVGQEKALKSPDAAKGVLRITRHPMMWGFMLWALAHILARGELKSTLFFGSFLVLAGLGAALIDARKAKKLGEKWTRFVAVTSYFPFAAIAQGRNRLVWSEIGWRSPAIGLALYVLIFWLHPVAFGARPY
jgi:uncharacterized membrane protein